MNNYSSCREQPIKIVLRDKSYVFHYWIRWSDGRQELLEVKPSEKLVLDDARRNYIFSCP